MSELKPLLIEADETDDLLQARRRKKEFLLFSSLLAVTLVALNLIYGMFLYSRHGRSNCLSCHSRNTPAVMWEPTGRHSPGFACSPCHGLLPGQHGRCAAFSAHADTVNPNCLGCHPEIRNGLPLPKSAEVRLVQSLGSVEEETVFQWNLRDLMYKWHVGNQVCVCTDCHRNLAHDKEGVRTAASRPKLAYCKECHYHAAKDAYVNVDPLPRIELVADRLTHASPPADAAAARLAGIVRAAEAAALAGDRAVTSTAAEAAVLTERASALAADEPAVTGSGSPKADSLGGGRFEPAAAHRLIYQLPFRAYHRKGEQLVRETGKDCRECHQAAYYPWQDFFGWEYRWKWQLHWLLFSGSLFCVLMGAYVSVQFWRRGERSSLHHPVHWPSVLRGLIREGMLGRRIYRQSRLRWSIFFFISMAFLALTAVFLLTLLMRFLLPTGNLFTDSASLVLDFLADLLGGMVTVGVLLAIFRRTLGREPHLKSELEDFAILLLLLAIVLTGFFLEACRLAVVAQEPRIWASFLGASLAALLRLWDLPWAAIRFYVWVLHAGLVFGFFAYLPFSKLFHVITSPISIAATASEAHYRQQQ